MCAQPAEHEAHAQQHVAATHTDRQVCVSVCNIVVDPVWLGNALAAAILLHVFSSICLFLIEFPPTWQHRWQRPLSSPWTLAGIVQNYALSQTFFRDGQKPLALAPLNREFGRLPDRQPSDVAALVRVEQEWNLKLQAGNEHFK